MKIVIDIPRKEYERAKKGEWNCTIINKAVADATPLEKVLDDIKADIDAKQYSYMADKDYDEGIRFGLMLAYQIVNRHISGKE